VFRNVKDFGAKGDGVTDDTAAINNAISSGNRCGLPTGCASSSVSPALVYFPSGTYLVSSPIIAYYYTELTGDARNPPTLLATAGFQGIAVIDADPYIPNGNGAQWYVNQDNFYRSVRNFVIDVRRMPATSSATGLHWQVSQGTSLYNVVVQMSTDPSTAHQGIFMENGSGGVMGDLTFNGGKFGIWIGNQQFTVRNLTVNNAQIGVHAQWNWGWTFQTLNINNCQIGFEMVTGGTTQATQTAGAEAIIDANVQNTPVFLQTTATSTGSLAGSILIDNVKLINVPTAVKEATGRVLLAGTTGSTTIRQWAQGNVYSGTSGTKTFIQSSTNPAAKPAGLLDSSGRIFGRGRPQYANFDVTQFVSVKTQGAKGDGTTDDTAALQAVFNQFAGCKIIFFDAGTYIITDTLQIPPGTQMVGEAWSQIMVSGSKFQNINAPHVGVQVGTPGSTEIVEISDIIFTTRGPAPGAIVVEWNIGASSQGSAGTWDTHIRLGAATGTNMGATQCPTTTTPSNTACFASYLAFHLTSSASAYLEGLWVWLGDHDLDQDPTQITVFSGRGILSQSQGPVWMIGTGSEHHVLYQYSLVNAKNHYMGLIQTETPYFQPNPAPPSPFPTNTSLSDPTFTNVPAAWGLWVQASTGILIYGAGHYSFFQNYGQACLTGNTCQPQIANIDSTSSVQLYSLSTVGTTFQLSVNGNGIINQANNVNGFASTVTLWT